MFRYPFKTTKEKYSLKNSSAYLNFRESNFSEF